MVLWLVEQSHSRIPWMWDCHAFWRHCIACIRTSCSTALVWTPLP